MRAVSTRACVVDLTLGAIGGGIVGAIIAVNIVIYAGPEDGYESSITDVFAHNALTGISAAVALVAGPALGVALARRRHRS